MKSIFFLLLTCFLTSFVAQAKEPFSVSLWPQFNWLRRDVETRIEEALGAGDYLILTQGYWRPFHLHADAYAIDPSKVLLEVSMNDWADIGQSVRDRQPEIGGFFVNGFSLATVRMAREYCEEEGKFLGISQDIEAASRGVSRRDAVEEAQVYIVDYEWALRNKPEKSAKRLLDVLERIREDREDLPVWVCAEFKLGENDPEDILALMDLIDEDFAGIVLKFGASVHQTAAAIEVLKQYRSAHPVD